MKVAILAGGLGSRLAEETEIKPKPMVEIGGQPILWHIIKHYAHYNLKEFYVALGYRGELIKRYFMDYYDLSGSISIDLANGRVDRQDRDCEDWVVHLKNTGQGTNTGGRIKRLEKYLSDGTFMATYGDGVCDVNLLDLLAFHRAHGRIATVTAVRPPARFGGLIFDGDSMVVDFTEKPQIGEGWINGGFMVFEPEIFKYLANDDSSLEAHALERLASERQLAAYKHEGFWQCMDTLRDKRLLENLWQEQRAPWKVWE
jgi:glucose-1-phosphate cytidylyltransferase